MSETQTKSRPQSTLFRYIEELHGDRPWGSVLDAGTGKKSLGWITGLATDRWTAVTASTTMAEQARAPVARIMRADDRIIVGNWMDGGLLAGETYDVVLADYLLGAVDGFSPYWQDQMFHRLRPLVGGRLYITGLEPYVPYPPETEAGRVIWEIGRLRDACLLLAGERPYREFPADWVLRHMNAAGFRVIGGRHFPIRYRARFVNTQLDMCRARLRNFSDPALAQAMADRVERLRDHALALERREGGLRHGADYVIAAEPAD